MAPVPQFRRSSPLSWVTSHTARYPLLLTLFAAAVAGSIYLENVSSLYMGRVFDGLKTQGTSSELLDTVGWLLLVLLGLGVLQLLSTHSVLRLRLKVERDMRQEIYHSLLSKSQTFHDATRVGDLLALSTNELRNLSVMFQPGLIMSLRSLLYYLIPLFFIATRFSRSLLPNPLLFSLLSFWLLSVYSRRITEITQQVRSRFGLLNSHLNEVIEGVELVRSTAQEEAFVSSRQSWRSFARRCLTTGRGVSATSSGLCGSVGSTSTLTKG